MTGRKEGKLMTDQQSVAIVTGSATGLGAATAIKLAERGVRVVINYSKSEHDALETEKACRQKGVDTLCLQANVSEDHDCRSLAEAALSEFGRIDILINNAGTTKFADHKDLDALSAEDFQRIYATNVIGAYQMTRAVAPTMKTQGYGSIVNVASIAGVAGIGSSVAYAASKGAMNTMTLSLARALAPEIRVNAVCPGFIGTRWFKDQWGDEYERRTAKIAADTPLHRAASPEDIADTVVFLSLEGARNITGELIITDSGAHLNFTPLAAR